MKTSEFEKDILAPFLKLCSDKCKEQGHHIEKYPFRITIGSYCDLTLCYKCNDLFQEVMREKSLLYLDEEEPNII